MSGNARAYRDHRAPLGEARAEPEVLLQPAAQAVQSLGHLFPRPEREIVDTSVDLDAGDNALARQVFREGLVAGKRALANGLVEQDHPAYEFFDASRSEQQIAVGAAARLVALDADRLEAFFAGAARFVRGEQPLAPGDHGCGGPGKQISVHEAFLLPDGDGKAEGRDFTLPGSGFAKRSAPSEG